MADFNAKDYTRFIEKESQAARTKRMRLDSIAKGSHVLVFNSGWAGRDETKAQTWHTVETLTCYSDSIVEMTCTDGRKVSGSDVLLVAGEKTTETFLICLNDREREFVEALARADRNDLEVYPDWERDSFVVVNRENRREHRVGLKTVRGKVLASCTCEDFKRRSRICKHQAIVLRRCGIGSDGAAFPADVVIAFPTPQRKLFVVPKQPATVRQFGQRY